MKKRTLLGCVIIAIVIVFLIGVFHGNPYLIYNKGIVTKYKTYEQVNMEKSDRHEFKEDAYIYLLSFSSKQPHITTKMEEEFVEKNLVKVAPFIWKTSNSNVGNIFTVELGTNITYYVLLAN